MSSISVCITYFNEGALLSECLNSLAVQTSPVDEVLIYDDASSEPPTPHIPDGLRVRIVRGSINVGPATGRNILLRESAADYIHFHDADDWFEVDWCRSIRDKINKSDADVIFTEIKSYRNGAIVCNKVLGLEQLASDSDLIRFSIAGVLLVPSGTYRRSALLQIGGYRSTMWQSEDFDFHVRLALERPSYAILLDPLVCIRLHQGNRSRDQLACYNDIVYSIEMNAIHIPSRYSDDVCERVAGIGCALLRLNDQGGAARALRLAGRFGRPRFVKERMLFRSIARVARPDRAVRLARVYRIMCPQVIREWVASRGL